mmetsp:Transcript_28205/g.33433  ORF Transcript_28205/g.33433 Transcript_28205/m.33433 type:complete len:1776 (+) Transcript_28205:50-5377(+)
MSRESHLWQRSASRILQDDESDGETGYSRRSDALRISTDEAPSSFADIEDLIQNDQSVEIGQLNRGDSGRSSDEHVTLPQPYFHAKTRGVPEPAPAPSPTPQRKRGSLAKVQMRNIDSPLSERGISAVRTHWSAQRHYNEKIEKEAKESHGRRVASDDVGGVRSRQRDVPNNTFIRPPRKSLNRDGTPNTEDKKAKSNQKEVVDENQKNNGKSNNRPRPQYPPRSLSQNDVMGSSSILKKSSIKDPNRNRGVSRVHSSPSKAPPSPRPSSGGSSSGLASRTSSSRLSGSSSTSSSSKGGTVSGGAGGQIIGQSLNSRRTSSSSGSIDSNGQQQKKKTRTSSQRISKESLSDSSTFTPTKIRKKSGAKKSSPKKNNATRTIDPLKDPLKDPDSKNTEESPQDPEGEPPPSSARPKPVRKRTTTQRVRVSSNDSDISEGGGISRHRRRGSSNESGATSGEAVSSGRGSGRVSSNDSSTRKRVSSNDSASSARGSGKSSTDNNINHANKVVMDIDGTIVPFPTQTTTTSHALKKDNEFKVEDIIGRSRFDSGDGAIGGINKMVEDDDADAGSGNGSDFDIDDFPDNVGGGLGEDDTISLNKTSSGNSLLTLENLEKIEEKERLNSESSPNALDHATGGGSGSGTNSLFFGSKVSANTLSFDALNKKKKSHKSSSSSSSTSKHGDQTQTNNRSLLSSESVNSLKESSSSSSKNSKDKRSEAGGISQINKTNHTNSTQIPNLGSRLNRNSTDKNKDEFTVSTMVSVLPPSLKDVEKKLSDGTKHFLPADVGLTKGERGSILGFITLDTMLKAKQALTGKYHGSDLLSSFQKDGLVVVKFTKGTFCLHPHQIQFDETTKELVQQQMKENKYLSYTIDELESRFRDAANQETTMMSTQRGNGVRGSGDNAHSHMLASTADFLTVNTCKRLVRSLRLESYRPYRQSYILKQKEKDDDDKNGKEDNKEEGSDELFNEDDEENRMIQVIVDIDENTEDGIKWVADWPKAGLSELDDAIALMIEESDSSPNIDNNNSDVNSEDPAMTDNLLDVYQFAELYGAIQRNEILIGQPPIPKVIKKVQPQNTSSSSSSSSAHQSTFSPPKHSTSDSPSKYRQHANISKTFDAKTSNDHFKSISNEGDHQNSISYVRGLSDGDTKKQTSDNRNNKNKSNQLQEEVRWKIEFIDNDFDILLSVYKSAMKVVNRIQRFASNSVESFDDGESGVLDNRTFKGIVRKLHEQAQVEQRKEEGEEEGKKSGDLRSSSDSLTDRVTDNDVPTKPTRGRSKHRFDDEDNRGMMSSQTDIFSSNNGGGRGGDGGSTSFPHLGEFSNIFYELPILTDNELDEGFASIEGKKPSKDYHKNKTEIEIFEENYMKTLNEKSFSFCILFLIRNYHPNPLRVLQEQKDRIQRDKEKQQQNNHSNSSKSHKSLKMKKSSSIDKDQENSKLNSKEIEDKKKKKKHSHHSPDKKSRHDREGNTSNRKQNNNSSSSSSTPYSSSPSLSINSSNNQSSKSSDHRALSLESADRKKKKEKEREARMNADGVIVIKDKDRTRGKSKERKNRHSIGSNNSGSSSSSIGGSSSYSHKSSSSDNSQITGNLILREIDGVTIALNKPAIPMRLSGDRRPAGRRRSRSEEHVTSKSSPSGYSDKSDDDFWQEFDNAFTPNDSRSSSSSLSAHSPSTSSSHKSHSKSSSKKHKSSSSASSSSLSSSSSSNNSFRPKKNSTKAMLMKSSWKKKYKNTNVGGGGGGGKKSSSSKRGDRINSLESVTEENEEEEDEEEEDEEV